MGNSFKNISIFLVTWGVIFVIVHLLHMRFFAVDVILYAAMFDLLVSGFIFAALYFFVLRPRLKLTKDVITLASLLALACGYIFSITIPTVIDRSLSAYILEKLDYRGGGIKEASMTDMFIAEYIPEYRMMDMRLQEALSSGTVVIENGCVKLTAKGRNIARFTKFYRNHLLPKKRILLDDVTDALTDPYENSPTEVDYLCDPTLN